MQSSLVGYEVQVLLATYNGAKFLQEFLLSLQNQNCVRINLTVGDDGSEDETLEIIESFRSGFYKVTILEGPRKGPAANFFNLLKNANSEYVALADQDDIWKPNHLIDSIELLNVKSNEPKMVYSSVLEFGNSIPTHNKWPKCTSEHGFESFFFQNYARGCTIVMNRKLVEFIASNQNSNLVIMHDWWIALVAKSCGQAIFVREPHIYYRLHANNVVGNKGATRSRTIKQIFCGKWAPFNQLLELFRIFAKEMKQDEKRKLEIVLEILNQGTIQRIKTVSFLKMRLRDRLLDEFKVRTILVIYPIFSRN
jgi:glycosyltransferase involved in cell wall biosynthesis